MDGTFVQKVNKTYFATIEVKNEYKSPVKCMKYQIVLYCVCRLALNMPA